jgi:nitroimidazol reductase NimA-like FMN-containing flavoprotein (pyridoxamine 5'-phosphate oxidase superfamily)
MPPSPRSTVRRIAELAAYERETVDAVLDAGLVAHVGIVQDGAPVVIPMAYARVGDEVYLHGSVAGRLLRALRPGAPVCVTVTMVDGVVLARSAFNMSMQYRSVVVQGETRPVDDGEERLRAFRAIMDQVVPGHWDHVRAPNDSELRQTLVVAVGLAEASAKISAGPPDDEPDDLALPHWAGVLPLRTVPGAPIADDHVPDGVPPPPSVAAYARRFDPAEVPGT